MLTYVEFTSSVLDCVLCPYLFNILAETRETLGGFPGELQIWGRIVTNFRYADDIILLAISEAELQELVDRLDRVSRKYILLINVDKTKAMASDSIACRILMQCRMSNWSRWIRSRIYLGSLITEDGDCTTKFRTKLNNGQAIEASLRKIYGKDTAYRFQRRRD